MALTDETRKQMEDYYMKEVECPSCNSSKNVVRVVTGRPTADLQEFVAENPGKIELAGCAAQTEDGKRVTHKCTSCPKNFGV